MPRHEEQVTLAYGAERAFRPNPFIAPTLQALGRDTQLWIAQRDRDLRQIQRLAQSSFPLLLIEQLLDVRHITGEHA